MSAFTKSIARRTHYLSMGKVGREDAYRAFYKWLPRMADEALDGMSASRRRIFKDVVGRAFANAYAAHQDLKTLTRDFNKSLPALEDDFKAACASAGTPTQGVDAWPHTRGKGRRQPKRYEVGGKAWRRDQDLIEDEE